MKKLKEFALVAVLSFSVTGCQTISDNSYKSGLFAKKWNTDDAISLKIYTTEVDRLDVDSYLKWLSASREQIMGVLVDRNLHDADKADTESRRKIGYGITGTIAGIAGATLVVASPANAVWVAALSGISGGIVAMQSSREAEGYSREGGCKIFCVNG